MDAAHTIRKLINRLSRSVSIRSCVERMKGPYDESFQATQYHRSALSPSESSWRVKQTRYQADAFRDEIRKRDCGCVVTGIRAEEEDWIAFQASHIFPRVWENVWLQHNYRRWVTDDPHHPDTGSSIDSSRNGLLMTATVHILFDACAFSINPDVSFFLFVFL